jgi:hypothetical protein
MHEKDIPARRWLLPFTQDLDLTVLEAALRLAEAGDATLIALSLIVTQPERNARLERIQQSKDFLEALRYKALRMHIACERYEAYTSDPLAQITFQARDLACDGVLLASKGQQSLLLSSEVSRSLLLHPPGALLLIRLPVRTAPRLLLGVEHALLSWLHYPGWQGNSALLTKMSRSERGNVSQG